MYNFFSNSNLIIQAFMAVIVVGMFYSLWNSTKLYGGIIGKAIRLFGLGMLFITLSILEHLLIVFMVIQNNPQLAIVQDIMSLVGLVFLAFGFSTLAAAVKP
jgi:hypothetical protein